MHELDDFGLEDLAGKTVVTNTVNDERLQHFREKGVQMVVDGAPLVHGHALAPAPLDAMILAATGRAPDDLLEDDYVEILDSQGLEPRILYSGGFKRVNCFNFVIHPLLQPSGQGFT